MPIADELEMLAAQREAGHLSEDEYASAKAAVLSGSTHNGHEFRQRQPRRLLWGGIGFTVALVIVGAFGAATYNFGTLVLDVHHRSGTLSSNPAISSLRQANDTQIDSNPGQGAASPDANGSASPDANGSASPDVGTGGAASDAGVPVPEVIGLTVQTQSQGCRVRG